MNIQYPAVHDNNSSHAMHFTSPQQFCEVAMALYNKTAPAKMLDRRGGENDDFGYASSFTGYKTGHELRDDVYNRRCSETVRARVHAAAIDVNSFQTGQQDNQQVDMYHDESGLFLDSNAYFNGDEFNMVSLEFQQQTKPIVYLAVCIGADSSWEDYHFQNRGIAAIRAVHALERQGVSVGVLGYTVAETGSQRIILTVIIKAPEQALDESDMINTLTNCTMLRTAGFQLRMYAARGTLRNVGLSCDMKKRDLKHAGLGDNELAILPYSHGSEDQYSTIERATAKLTEAINKQTSITI